MADSKSIDRHTWGRITNCVFRSLYFLFCKLVFGLLIFSLSIPTSLAIEKAVTLNRPNILLIAIDDLNDWVGCLGGHPQAATPNIDRLAKDGTLFTNAHCQAPVCQPSRASLMTSTHPSSSGLYFLVPGIAASPITKNKKHAPGAICRRRISCFRCRKIISRYQRTCI